MNFFLSIVIHTANILGIFTDPFEFEGDYGPEVNPIRQKVFEKVMAKEAFSENLDSEMRELMQKSDKEYGPTFLELVTSELMDEIAKKQKDLNGFANRDLSKIFYFLERYGDQKVFYFFRNNPAEFLSLDKALRAKASRDGKSFDLPILSSTQILKASNASDLKRDLLDAVFTEETLSLARSETDLKRSLKKLDKDFLQKFFGEGAKNDDLELFCSPAGQTFFYWAYQALNLHLVAQDPGMIEQINQVKEIFANTIGEPKSRAQALKKKLLVANSGVLFTQECDAFLPHTLTCDGTFWPVDKQNPQDGCFIFLRRDLWEPDYELIDIEGYAGFKEGRMVVILATRKNSDEKFLLASCHGHSTMAEDGRLQVTLVMKTFHQLSQDLDLQLLIGIDANTKTEEDGRLLREHLDHLGLTATSVGPTTIKKRMVTAQHAKAGKVAIDEEDYLITLKPENGGRFLLTHSTVGFKEERADINKPLPNRDNPSDHYPVGATLSFLNGKN